MSELASPPPHTADPSLTLGNTPLPANAELQQAVNGAIESLNQDFQLDIDPGGNFQTEPTADQLAQLKDWHEATSTAPNGEEGADIAMPTEGIFTKKMILAKALMPQRDESGNILYLFGKGAGMELALQGEVNGRDKRDIEVPYRTHSDFEIYGAIATNYDQIPHGDRFKAVFGGQEIYPVTETKGLHELPPDFLHKSAEAVDYGGVEFLVPRLELQLVDKFEKANERVERSLRDKTDAEWLASTYDLNGEVVHAAIDDFVISPELAKLPEPTQAAEHNTALLERKLTQTKKRLAEDMPLASDKELTLAAGKDFVLSHFGKNIGVADMMTLVDIETGQLISNSTQLLNETEAQRQATAVSALKAKHGQVDAILQAA